MTDVSQFSDAKFWTLFFSFILGMFACMLFYAHRFRGGIKYEVENKRVLYAAMVTLGIFLILSNEVIIPLLIEYLLNNVPQINQLAAVLTLSTICGLLPGVVIYFLAVKFTVPKNNESH